MKHVIVLIHGISDGKPTDDFQKFWKRLSDVYTKRTKEKFDDHFEPMPINWDKATNEGEENIFEYCFGPTESADDDLVRGNLLETSKSLFNTRAWRYFSTYLAGDVIAYIDESDNQIRSTAWQEFKKLVKPDGSVRKFSVIGHSLGSVIAYDFVYSMMQKGQLFSFTKSGEEQFNAANWQASFVNLYTMGSPIGLFLMRRKELWENRFALLKNPVDFHQQKPSRQWLNIWDKDDLVAYPLERIYGKNSVSLRDVEVDTGMLMPWAHTQYWSDPETADSIIESLI